MRKVEFMTNSNVLVNSSHADDAGIIKFDKEVALVQTLDFFTPVVDDPYLYGQIAAANALSDIYAMGAVPISALNIMCFPDTRLEDEAFKLIVQGGADKAYEAGVVILGGHSVSDNELKYGLSVTGKIHPRNIKLNNSLKSGDVLVLTKPIGTGILTTALKNSVVTENDLLDVIQSMTTLNKRASELLQKYAISACTDITGFGLLGHLWEMLQGSGLTGRIHVSKIPFFEKAIPFAKDMTQIPGGTLANQRYLHDHVDIGSIELWYQNLLYDPQTSGGLLISISADSAENFISELDGYPLTISIIGEVIKGENKIYLV